MKSREIKTKRDQIREQLAEAGNLGATTSNPKLEAEIIALCLRSADAAATAGSIIKDRDFTQRPLRLIYDAITQIRARFDIPNPLTVAAQLQLRDRLDDVGGEEFVRRLAVQEITGKPEQMASYCKSLQQFSYRRRLRYVAEKLTSLSNEPEDNADVAQKVRDLMKLAEDDTTPEDVLLTPGEIVEQIGLDKLFNPLLGETVMDTPSQRVNDIIIGFFQSTLNIVAARPSVGKSAWVAQILHYNAMKGIPCAFFSLEMKREAIVRRLACGIAEVSLRKVYKGETTSEERARLAAATAQMNSIPLLISNLYGRTTAQVEQAVRKADQEYGRIAMYAIDHAQLMRPLRKHGTRAHEIGEISGTLKLMSDERRIILLSQLNRSGKDRADQAPVLTDLRETGDLEQDADTVHMIHRPEMYKQDGDKSRTEYYLRKQRDGELGMAKLHFEGKYVSFRDAD